ncbi:MAG: DUF4445 domain-containing protein [Chloroflexi bacterium]|nr:DUF4445 domain-containing protein [Chloroflexota bacterium]
MDQPKIIFQPSGLSCQVDPGTTLLRAARLLGIELESSCGGRGICGKCRVNVVEGYFDPEALHSRSDHLSPRTSEESRLLVPRYGQETRLACCARVRGDLVVQVPAASLRQRQLLRKTVRQQAIPVKPAVVTYPVFLQDGPGGGRSLEGLLAELRRVYKLKGLRIDPLALHDFPRAMGQGQGEITATVWQGQEIIDVAPGVREACYGLAVDIGTTTLAAYLCDLVTGSIVAAASTANPQQDFGYDVISRITYVSGDQRRLDKMQRLVIGGINELTAEVARQGDIKVDDVLDGVMVGNSAMHHLALGLAPDGLAQAPYSPVLRQPLDVKARELGLSWAKGAYVHTLPLVGGFVGADTVAVLLAEDPQNEEAATLVIDIGTNGELVLSHRGRMVAASCATGPAFEGGHISCGMRAGEGAIEAWRIDPRTYEVAYSAIGENGSLHPTRPQGLCGTGVISSVAEMLKAGIILPRGNFNVAISSPRLRRGPGGEGEFVLVWDQDAALGRDIVLTQRDIRAVQVAKAALSAGAQVLMRHMGLERPERILLAGAFGNSLDPQQASILGLFPPCAPEQVHMVGNAAGAGACIALVNHERRARALEIVQGVEYVELASEKDFQEVFIQATLFPDHRDSPA